jgi:hypothetical protein
MSHFSFHVTNYKSDYRRSFQSYKLIYMFVFHFDVVFGRFQMTSSTLVNLVKNSNNLPIAVGKEHWTFSTQEDKYLYLIEGCKSKESDAKNHFCKHMLLHNLHIVWDNHGHPKKIIGKFRIQIN